MRTGAIRSLGRTAAAALLLGLAAAPASAVSTLEVVVLDGPGEGFRDPAPFTPAGGNPAATVGEARLIAFRFAAHLWGSSLTSPVVVRIDARMDPLGGDATSAILGQAAANTVHRDFPGAPVAATWYPQALANSRAGVDLAPAANDIRATFNTDVDGPVVLGATSWYYGLDANPPAGTVDFVTVVLHELGHGLGFQTFANLATGAKLSGFDDTYLRHLERHGGSPSGLTAQTDPQRAASFVADPNLHWLGSRTLTAAAALPLTAGFPGGHVRIHAPSPLVIGSSVSHFSTALFPNQLMEPSYTGPNHDLGLALPLLEDIGWALQPRNGTDVVFILDVTGSTGALIDGWKDQVPLIADAWKDFDPNARFALASHVDCPYSPYGEADEWAYRVETVFTPDPDDLVLALDLLTQQIGGDDPESQYEAVYQVLTGAGRDLVPPVNYDVSLGEIPPVGLGQLYPMVIYHFTFPEVFHDRDLEPGYPFPGASPVAGRSLVLSELAVRSSQNMFFGLTFVGDPAFTAGAGPNQPVPPRRVTAPLGEVTEGPLAEMAAMTGGAVYDVGAGDLSLLLEAIDRSIERWSVSRQAGDADGDGVEDASDNCPVTPNPSQADGDGDAVGDACDNCPSTFNPGQADSNLDGIGDACSGAVCIADQHTLCLNGGRFRVRADWRTVFGTSGQATAVPLTADTGYFWFFDPANVEMVVKVLRGCPVNGRYWVFAGGLTDVAVDLTVTDTERGGTKTYRNPLRTPFQPIQDAAAFATCP